MYSTAFVSGGTSSTDKLADVRVGDVGVASCGHATIALSGSPTTMTDKLPVHRVGDTGANCGAYISVSGSPTTIVN